MLLYAGIDEAGYGPMFGPLLVSRTVMSIRDHSPSDTLPDLWQHLAKAVCRTRSKRKGRIPINDSKKIYSPASGLKHLELGVLSAAGLTDLKPTTLCQWLDGIGETCHHNLNELPWYQPTQARPWADLPTANSPDELAIARSMLASTCEQAGVQLIDLGAAVVFENRFNRMVSATRSKAATSFTFVSSHLRAIWDRFSSQHPSVIVDRQSGRTHYRHLIAMTFPDTDLAVLQEDPKQSSYLLSAQRNQQKHSMTIRFEVDADANHMPVAIASMISKYTRELLMARFQNWFTHHAPQIKPTAGYATDAKRFWTQIQPLLPQLRIQPDQLRRIS